MAKKWIVTAVDTSDSADGKARVLKVCATREEAESFIEDDIADFAADAEDMDLVVEQGKMSAHTRDYSYGCEWNLEEVEV